MQGVVRREYREYWQGPQRGSGAHGDLPKGAPHGACGGVAPLGNASSIPCGERALPQTPWDALKRQNTRDATLAEHAVAQLTDKLLHLASAGLRARES